MNVRIEQVTYKSPEMLDASLALMRKISKDAGIFTPEQCALSFVSLTRVIKGKKNESVTMSSRDVVLGFSGIPEIAEQKVGEEVIFSAEAPYFWIQDKAGRHQIKYVMHDIFYDMRDDYYMEPDMPNKLIFPKEKYGEKIEISEVPLLGSSS